MSCYTPSPQDLALVKQQSQRRIIMVEILNRTFQKISVITGDCIEFNSSIDSSSDIRRTCSLEILVKDLSYITSNNTTIDKKITIDKYIKVYQGIYNESGNTFKWYSVGVFCVGANNYSYNATTCTLSINCQDLMAELTGERRGYTPQYSPFIEKGLEIKGVIITILEQYAGIVNYDIADIGGLVNGIFSNKVPVALSFSTGATMYEMLNKLVTIYPQWEMFFDADGKFIVQQEVLEENNDAVALDDNSLSKLNIEESRNNSYSEIYNCSIVYGKDGKYQATVKDTTIGSPYNVNAVGEIWHEPYTDENIESDDEANNWAVYYNYKTTRLFDNITLKVINLPFINDVNFKISYRSKLDNQLKYYIIKKVTNSYSDDTTVLECIQFYNENTSAYQPSLAAPTIIANTDKLILSVIIAPVNCANLYKIYANNILLGTINGTTFTYTFPSNKTGKYDISAKSVADGYKDSNMSNNVSVEIAEDYVITSDNDTFITSDGDRFIYKD